MTNRNYNFAGGERYFESLRSSGYKNVARALAELVDNSIQAGASDVEILLTEHKVPANQYTVRRVKEIAVLDNGQGMDKTLLRRSLCLGDGTHFDDQEGIGKFGVGLPQASISQAKRVDAWSWQGGIENIHHTYIDLGDSEWTQEGVVPEPDSETKIPKKWQEMSSFDEDSGTLIVWSKVDRCNWKKGSTIYSNSEDLIGRMYRNWIYPDTNHPDVSISLTVYNEESEEVDESWEFEPNDPLYLMDNTNVPLPDGVPDPMFELVSDPIEREYEVTTNGETTTETVTMTFSVCKEETRRRVDGQPAGSAPHGKHAKMNKGLSIVREGRELLIDGNWAPADEPRHRWWGAQIEFGRRMDEIFGVSNDKQGADRLTEMTSVEWDDYAEEGESTQETRERLKSEDFPTFVCLDLKHKIDQIIREALLPKVKEIGQYGVNDTGEEETRHEDTPERVATEATKDRQSEGQTGESDDEEDLSDNEKEEKIRTRLKQQNVDKTVIDEVTGDIKDHGLKYVFVERPLASAQIFSVEPTAGTIIIGINKDHLAYDKLFSTLELDSDEEVEEENAVEKLEAANTALKLLIEAWARMEDEETTKKTNQLRDIRTDWGRVAREFLAHDHGPE